MISRMIVFITKDLSHSRLIARLANELLKILNLPFLETRASAFLSGIFRALSLGITPDHRPIGSPYAPAGVTVRGRPLTIIRDTGAL